MRGRHALVPEAWLRLLGVTLPRVRYCCSGGQATNEYLTTICGALFLAPNLGLRLSCPVLQLVSQAVCGRDIITTVRWIRYTL